VCVSIEIYYLIKKVMQTNEYLFQVCLVANLATKFNYHLNQLGTFLCEVALIG
jgi:hypothetical protein